MKDHNFEVRSEEFRLEKVEKQGDEFYFIARSLSKDFECEDGLKRLAKDSVNKSYIWRHNHPIQEGNTKTHIYGTIADSWYEDGYVYSKYQVYGHTLEHAALRKLIEDRLQEDDPLGVSMHYRVYKNEENKAIHYDVFEHSGTPIPACKDCKTLIGGHTTMANEKEEEELEEEEELSETQKRIQELEKILDSKTKSLEEYKTKIEDMEHEIKKRESKLEQERQENMTLEDKVNELRDEVTYLQKKPLIDELVELEDTERFRKFYKQMEKEDLEDELEEAREKAGTAVTESMEDTAENADVDDNVNEEEEVSFEQFTQNL